jgi:hypothetical protein
MFAGFKRLYNLNRDTECFISGNGPTRETFGKRFAINELHRKKVGPLGFLKAIQRGNVRMIQCCQRAGFSFEPFRTVTISDECFRQQLDRNATAQPRVTRAVHFTHPASTEQGFDFVMSQSFANHFAVQFNTPWISGGGPGSSTLFWVGTIITNLPSGMMS